MEAKDAGLVAISNVVFVKLEVRVGLLWSSTSTTSSSLTIWLETIILNLELFLCLLLVLITMANFEKYFFKSSDSNTV